jgi:hypothetical protein
MLEHVRTDLDRLKAQSQTLKDRQDRLEQILQPKVDTARTRVEKTLGRLRSLLANGKLDSSSFRLATDWMELEDLAEGLRQLKSRLPPGLFRQIWSRLRDSRQRLERDPGDAYAISQLDYIEKVLAQAAQKLE